MISQQQERSGLIGTWQIGNMVWFDVVIGNGSACAHLIVLVLAVAWFAMWMTSEETAADQRAGCDVTRWVCVVCIELRDAQTCDWVCTIDYISQLPNTCA
jgi:hypothetical protein